jgi:hypothetical protein
METAPIVAEGMVMAVAAATSNAAPRETIMVLLQNSRNSTVATTVKMKERSLARDKESLGCCRCVSRQSAMMQE